VDVPVFLDVDDVIWIHDVQIELFGGQNGIRDRGLLESAVAMPQQGFGGEYLHDDLFVMAAAYAFHLAKNHPFIDGNKRTALASCLDFLDVNGIVVTDENGRLYETMLSVATGTLDKTALAELLQTLSRG
jgi:death on curing protein